MKKCTTIFFTALCLLAVALMAEQTARAETLCVNPGGTGGCYDSIQGAIDASGAIDTATASGADRLAALQNDDGGWDWPLDDGNPANASPANTVGPIAMGLAQAYIRTGDPDHLTALQNAGGFLLAKTNTFSPSDGYLAAMLDQVLGGTAYTDHVTTYFYDQLAAGTYDRNGLGTLYDTASYVQMIRDARFNQGIANLAAWDIGMGLVGAASAGAGTAEWIAGVKAEIDELDGAAYYDVIGLAGAVYGLAFVGEDFDPTAGEHAAAGSLGDLAAILAGYQIAGGGFTWNSNYLNPGEGNETIQETAYAILALNEVDRTGYLVEIQGAADYMRGVQLVTGGWENYAGSGENNEITAEALWGHAVVYPAGGTTIVVAAGSYDEPVNIDGKNGLTITGEDKTTVIIQAASTLNWNACGVTTQRKAVFRIVNSTGVLLQNMTMDFDLVKANNVMGIFGCDSSVTVDNNILMNMSVPDASGGYYEVGSYFRAPGFTDEARADITITGNTFIDTGRLGVVTHDYIFATIDGNTFYKTTDDFGYAIELGSRSTGVICNNLIYGFDTPALSDGSASAGIYIENAFTGTLFGGPGPHVEKNVTVENNEIYDCQYGMWIGNGYNGYAGDVDITVILNGNNFHDNTDGGAWIQDEDKADGSSVKVIGGGNSWTNNGTCGVRIYSNGDGDITVNLMWETITGHETGVRVEDNAGGTSNSSYSVSITQSDILNNTAYGIDNTVSSFTVNAKYNWWGDASGPLDPGGTNETDGVTCYPPSTMLNADGSGNPVSDLHVDYCPWHTYQNPDIDGDGICNPYTVHPSCVGSDNCPLTPNPGQEDNYPPGGNGIGDACECEADFDCDGDVDAEDVTRFLWDFGRNEFYDPCTNERWCYGDFTCDGDVDAVDVNKFMEDFGRNPYNNPCPAVIGACQRQNWCSY